MSCRLSPAEKRESPDRKPLGHQNVAIVEEDGIVRRDKCRQDGGATIASLPFSPLPYIHDPMLTKRCYNKAEFYHKGELGNGEENPGHHRRRRREL